MFAPVDVALLGPLVVKGDAGEIVVSAAKQRALLELLALRSDQPLTSELLCAGLWGENEPATATKALQMYVSHLRRLLPADCLVTVGEGYALRIGRGSVDAARFEDALQRSAEFRTARDLSSAAGLLADGLRLWRGPPCRELTEHSWATAEVVRLEELRRGAEEDLFDVRIAAGQHTSVVADLEASVVAEPLRERRWGQLMLALYRCGRQAEALRAFQRARHILADELGIDPSPQLVALDQDILAQAPGLARTETPTAPGLLTDPSTQSLQPEAGSRVGRLPLLCHQRAGYDRRLPHPALPVSTNPRYPDCWRPQRPARLLGEETFLTPSWTCGLPPETGPAPGPCYSLASPAWERRGSPPS